MLKQIIRSRRELKFRCRKVTVYHILFSIPSPITPIIPRFLEYHSHCRKKCNALIDIWFHLTAFNHVGARTVAGLDVGVLADLPGHFAALLGLDVLLHLLGENIHVKIRGHA